MEARDILIEILSGAGLEYNPHDIYELYETKSIRTMATILAGQLNAYSYKIVPMSSDESFNTVDDNGE